MLVFLHLTDRAGDCGIIWPAGDAPQLLAVQSDISERQRQIEDATPAPAEIYEVRITPNNSDPNCGIESPR